ncbi:hypothetical protein SAMN02745751_01602 [Dethiosulfatibacter aminovorans DSM 17477]|uniref:Major capsid protein, N4-gp56 family n=1 Tax=Dethiosulfatibacter aminovorans DSM 17477 TaxID=1121476 RepID=A0A1M6FZN4_9FIRM|nr:hypothetical protein [Dethiosulfatibacter aminovorans]SHJ03153.1 hypothetical protein SAMN02745751_01602 [Dethiosulfatibacter aminovorans DSM 17477]
MALIIPALYKDSVLEKMSYKLRVSKLATDMTSDVFLIGSEGETVHFPVWDRIDEADVVTKGTEIDVETMSQTDSTATIYQIAKGVRVYDKDAKGVRGNMTDVAIEQTAGSLAEKIDSMLIATLDSEVSLSSATAAVNAITQTELLTGMGLFSDDQDADSFAGIVINSVLLSSFLGMDMFVSTGYTNTVDGNGIVRAGGLIGFFMGIPVYMSNHNTMSSDTTPEAKTYVIKKNALGYMFKQDLNVEIERLPKLFANDVVTSSMLATKLVDSSGALLLKKTIA